jgi:hypothetical protein
MKRRRYNRSAIESPTRYDTFDAFVDASAANPAGFTGMGMEPFWFGGVATLADAVQIARTGWPEGTARIQRISTSILNKVTSLIEIPQITYDVCGLDFDMGLHVSGVPEAWYDFRYQTQESQGFKHVHMVVNYAVSSGISADTIQTRGAIAAALVLSLEAANVRVTLDAVCAVANGTKECWVRLKNADMPLDIDRLSFALVHPAMLRWLLLANKHWWRDVPSDVNASSRGDIYIGKGHLEDAQWGDNTRAQEWIITQLRAQGVHLTTEDNNNV